MTTETFAFQAEINQLLSLIINTFYSNKDVFLRELISNASDAIDKIRYAAITNPELLGDAIELDIRITADKEAKTLTIQDTGLGMTKEDLIKNLGTIAHSGTRSFMEAIQDGQKPDISLIGQFGVGFYSAYLVAKNVKVISKSNDDVQYIWESSASGSFTVCEDIDGESIVRGTKIILELKDDLLEYLEEAKVRDIVKKHSEFCAFPIKYLVSREEEVEAETEVDADAEATDDVEGKVEEEEKDKVVEPKPKVKRTVKEFTQLNNQKPVWLRKPEDVTKEEYSAFYKSISNDWEDHLAVKHFAVDGQVQFKAALFVPKRPPFDMFQNAESKKNNMKLYVKKVLITDDSTALLPDYLSFMHGVVDSDDLPLNVSREMLQQNSIMKTITKALVKKAIELFASLDTETFTTFYTTYHKNIKLGAHVDTKNRPKLLELVRYYTTKSATTLTSLKDYVSRMKEEQKKIYYITGESLKAVQSSPFLEKLAKKDIEVIYMTDPIDEYMIQSVRDYDGKDLVCCSKDGIEIDEDQKEHEKEWEPICKKIKTLLGDKVQKVKLSNRLSTSPCVLVTDQYGWSANMERIMKAQALHSNSQGGGAQKILEINHEHAIIVDIKERIEKSISEKSITTILEMLYSTSLLDSGFSIEEPSKYAQQIYKIMSLGLSGEDDDEETVEVVKVQEPEPVESPLEEVD